MNDATEYTDEQIRRYAKMVRAKGRLLLARDRYKAEDAEAIAFGIEDQTGRTVAIYSDARGDDPVGMFVLMFDEAAGPLTRQDLVDEIEDITGVEVENIDDAAPNETRFDLSARVIDQPIRDSLNGLLDAGRIDDFHLHMQSENTASAVYVSATWGDPADLATRAETLEARWADLLENVEAVMEETAALANEAAQSDQKNLRHAATKLERQITAARDGTDGAVLWLRKMKFDARRSA